MGNKGKNDLQGFVSIDKDGWHLSSESAGKLDLESERKLERLKEWLSSNIRVIKLPNLLIGMDNELKITGHSMSVSQQRIPKLKRFTQFWLPLWLVVAISFPTLCLI